MPVNQMGGIYSTYPELAPELSFTTVKDYDDWIARLHAIPEAFAQVTQDMDIGMEDRRVPSKALLDKAVEATFAEPDPLHPRRTRAIVVVHHGRIVAERYAQGFDATMPLMGWSTSKSALLPRSSRNGLSSTMSTERTIPESWSISMISSIAAPSFSGTGAPLRG